MRHVGFVLMTIRTVVSKAKDHVWLASDHLFPQWPGIADTFPSVDFPVRLICDQTIEPKVIRDYRNHLSKCEVRALKKVNIAMAISESSAGVCFPDSKGNIDFNMGFAGSDPGFMSWCSDLFTYYWASPGSHGIT